MTGALKRSVLRLMDGDHTRLIAVTLKDGAGRFTGELVSLEHGVVILAIKDGSALISRPVEQVLSVELLSAC